jgi:chain length determinant protein EpsF
MTPQQIMLIVWAWRKLVLFIWVITIGIAVTVSLLLPKVYTASTSIYVDAKPDPILGAAMPGIATMGFMATQVEIIQSRRVAGRVVKLLRIADVPSVFQSWKEDTGGKIPLEDYYGDLLLKGLFVQPSRGSNIINLNYSGNDPRFATSVVNAFAQATLETNIELRVNPAREYAAFFDERLKTLRQGLEAAQAKLSAYQRKSGIVASGQRLDQEMARLMSLNADLSVVLAQKADITSREKNAGSELSPDVMQSSVIQRIRAEIAKTETALSEVGTVVGRNHPQRVQLEAQLATHKEQLALEMDRVSGGVSKANRVSTQKEMELRTAVEAQKKRVLSLQEEQDQIQILQGEVETARRAYDGVSQRMSLTTLESHSQQTNLSVLTPAVEPTEPSKPKILVNVAASVLAGLLLGIGAALGMELLDRPVRHRDDLANLEGVPYLGVLQPHDQYGKRRGRWTTAVDWLVRRIWGRQRSARPAAL